jgi:S1-C subfamily serine protease
MPEPQEYSKLAPLLKRIATILYGSPIPSSSVSVEDLYKQMPDDDTFEIDSTLKQLESQRLLSLSLNGHRIGLLGNGKAVFEQNCIAEKVLGRDYIIKKYRSAIAHIVVEGQTTDQTSGAGFFCTDFPNVLVTAAHVAKRKIITIEDVSGAVLTSSGQVKIPSDDLDLALLDCEMPAAVEPIRIEWNPKAVSEGASVIVFGYPKIAGHFPKLYQASAEVHSIGERYPSHRDSLIISKVTYPGCSGGPVVDLRGSAIGVIEQENDLELTEGTHDFYSSTPVHYLRNFV